MAAVDPAGNYRTAAYSLADGSEHTVFSLPAGDRSVMVTQISAAEQSGGARTLTLKAHLSGTDYYLVKSGAIDASDYFEREFKPLVLALGDSIKATASASTVDVLITYIAVNRKT